ncbi:MAG: hypothetical protein ACUVUF_06105 [Candidatus Bathycorpusculaceae bacterium]
MKFKTEILLLVLSIALYILSAYCYSFEALAEGTTSIYFPYKDYAIPLIVVASALLVTAAISYSKRRK